MPGRHILSTSNTNNTGNTKMKNKSQQAQVAAALKAFVVRMGLKASAKSDSFAGGDSVDLRVTNATLAQRAQIETECKAYQRGHVDGMQDMYISRECARPFSSKYVSAHFEYTSEVVQAAYAYAVEHVATDGEQSNLHTLYVDSANEFQKIGGASGDRVSSVIYQLLTGARKVWLDHKQVTIFEACPEVSAILSGKAKAEHVADDSAEVEYTTKRGKALRGRVFNGTKEEAQALDEYTFKHLGGWFIRTKHLDKPALVVEPVPFAPAVYAYSTEAEVVKAALQIMETRARREIAFTELEFTRNYFAAHLDGREAEVFSVAFLDNQHKLIECSDMFFGTIDGASVYPREVVKAALKHNAAAVIFAHNHPSGDATPSQADRGITMQLKDALGLVDVRVLDHIVVGTGETTSFAAHGYL